MKLKRRLYLSLIFILLAANNSYAQDVKAVRVTCVPEIHYFTVELNDYSHFGNFLEKEYKQSGNTASLWKDLKKYGILPDYKFDYICEFSNAKFRIWGYTPLPKLSGSCATNPRTIISMSKNDEVIIDNVLFEPGCADVMTNNINKITLEGEFSGNKNNFSTSVKNRKGSLIEINSFERFNQKYVDCLFSAKSLKKRKSCKK